MTASHAGEFVRARDLLEYLTFRSRHSLSANELLEALYWRGLSAVLQGFDSATTPAERCLLTDVAMDSVSRISQIGWQDGVSGAAGEHKSDYLRALATLWLVGDIASAGDLLRAAASAAPADREVQSARMLLAILAAVRSQEVERSELHTATTRLDYSYRRPPVVEAGQSGTFVVELAGAWLDIPITEALCAFGQRIARADIGITPDSMLSNHCAGSQPHPQVSAHLDRTIERLLDLTAAECPSTEHTGSR